MKKQLIILGVPLLLVLGILPSLAANTFYYQTCPCQKVIVPKKVITYCPAAPIQAPCCPTAVVPCCPAAPIQTPCCPTPCPCPAAPIVETCNDCCD